MGRSHLIAVGAVSIDTILHVPHFPKEDEKLRATRFGRRRGGNSPNSLEVLLQVLQQDGRSEVKLHLIAPFPSRSSRDNGLIRTSLGYATDEIRESDSTSSALKVNLDHCLYREDCNDAVSSYIIASEATNSRTIVNHNALPEMTFDEFVSKIEELINSSTQYSKCAHGDDKMWFHFEGRIPDVTLKCIRYLRENSKLRSDQLKISVEVEKPHREGLQALAPEADVVFYSKSWAEGENYASAEMCLREQARIIYDSVGGPEAQPVQDRLLICTWGSSGASAVTIRPSRSDNSFDREGSLLVPHVQHSAAYISDGSFIVDTTGAGDTFIAGMLFGLICKGEFAKDSEPWTTERMVDFANDLAGRKILQWGFHMEKISFKPR